MKKIFAVLGMLALTFFGVQLATAPAVSAGGCVIRNLVLDVPNSTNHTVHHDPKGTMKYKACGNYADFIEVSYQVYVDPANCGFQRIEWYRFNMDSIAHWDPRMKEWDCQVGRDSYVLFKDAPADARVFINGPENERCTIAHFKIGEDADFDDVKNSDKRCINFAN